MALPRTLNCKRGSLGGRKARSEPHVRAVRSASEGRGLDVRAQSPWAQLPQ